MSPREPRTLGYYAASHWFQWAVLFVMISGLVVVGILPALNEAKERAEKQSVELTIRNIRTGMQLAMGEALMRQREGEIAAWAGSNPVRWLETEPSGYRGECSATERRAPSGGRWCFDRESQELVYLPHHIEHLYVMGEMDSGECKDLRWRVVRPAVGEIPGSFVGLRLAPVSLCQWRLE